MMPVQELTSQIITLLDKAGLSSENISIEACSGGGNNRTYKIKTSDGYFLAKQYFRQSRDLRDRLTSEFEFLTYAANVAPYYVPKPYAKDNENALALYEFIDGKPFQTTEITEHEIACAIQLFRALNGPEAQKSGAKLPQASEACFSIEAHLDLVDDRICALQNIAVDTSIDQMALECIQQIAIYWQHLQSHIRKIAAANDYDVARPLDSLQRCISPSDFGFHNALLRQDGSICFLDFEYAGWDDPAKMASDFFAQLAVPVPAKLFDYFVKEVMAFFPDSAELVMRAGLLRYVYQVKWCCIALNVFLPAHLNRRRFANPNLDVNDIKKDQLAKAGSLIQNLELVSYG